MWTNSTIVGRKSGLQASNQGGEDKSFFSPEVDCAFAYNISFFAYNICVCICVFSALDIGQCLPTCWLLFQYRLHWQPKHSCLFCLFVFCLYFFYLFVFVCICLYFCILVFLAMTFLRCDGTRMDNNHVSVCDDTREMRTNYRKD